MQREVRGRFTRVNELEKKGASTATTATTTTAPPGGSSREPWWAVRIHTQQFDGSKVHTDAQNSKAASAKLLIRGLVETIRAKNSVHPQVRIAQKQAQQQAVVDAKLIGW